MNLSGLHLDTLFYVLLCLLCLAFVVIVAFCPQLLGKKGRNGQMVNGPSPKGSLSPFSSLRQLDEPDQPTKLPLSANAIGKTVLITTDHWFYAPDGKTYRAVFGTLRNVLADSDVLGIKTNARSTNWYLEVGNMVIAGCQIHYAMLADRSEMNFGKVTQDYREGLTVQAVTQEAVQ